MDPKLFNRNEPNIFDLEGAPPVYKQTRQPFGKRKPVTPPPFWRPDVNKG